MRKSVSGFKVQDTWSGIVDHGEEVSEALKKNGVESKGLDEWEKWRPKKDESIDDITEKTARQTSIEKNTIEKKENGLEKEVEKTKEKLTESVDSLKENNKKQAAGRLTRTGKHGLQSIKTVLRKIFRKTERIVYRLMTKFTPYYFDNQLVSAELKKTKKETYSFEININDDNLKRKIQEEL